MGRLSKKDEEQIWETLMARNRRLGPDPDDHPSVRRRMELQFLSILLTINWILAKITTRPDGTIQVSSPGRRFNITTILLSLIVALGIATTTFSWLAYQQTLITNDRKEIVRSQAEYLGRALMTNSKVKVERHGPNFVINYDWDLDESVTGTIRIPHKIPPEEIERLNQK